MNIIRSSILSPTNVRRIRIITLGSLCFLLLKAGLVELLELADRFPLWLNYLMITVSISLLGWVYHARLSFRQELTLRSLRRYIEQAVGLKILDYALVTMAVYLFSIRPLWAVIVIGGFLFVTRVFLYIKYVYKTPFTENGDFPSGREVR